MTILGVVTGDGWGYERPLRALAEDPSDGGWMVWDLANWVGGGVGLETSVGVPGSSELRRKMDESRRRCLPAEIDGDFGESGLVSTDRKRRP